MTEQEIVKILSKENKEFKKLGQDHKDLDVKLTAITGKGRLTPEEEAEKKSLKKLKLTKKDRMAELVRQYEKGLANK